MADAVSKERERLHAKLTRLTEARYAIERRNEQRKTEHEQFMANDAAARASMRASLEDSVDSHVKRLVEAQGRRRSVSVDVRELVEARTGMLETRSQLEAALNASEQRALQAETKLNGVVAELKKLKVAISVKEVHDAANELRHSKKKLELETLLDEHNAATHKAIAPRLEVGKQAIEGKLAEEFKPLIDYVKRKSGKDIRAIERKMNAEARAKAKQLSERAAKRFETVIWPALLQLETSTRAQQQAASALADEAEARKRELGDAEKVVTLAELAGSPGLSARFRSPSSCSGSEDRSLEALAYGEGSEYSPRPNLRRLDTAATAPSTGLAMFLDSEEDKFLKLKKKVKHMFAKCTEPGDRDWEMRFLRTAQQSIRYNKELDRQYRLERLELLR